MSDENQAGRKGSRGWTRRSDRPPAQRMQKTERLGNGGGWVRKGGECASRGYLYSAGDVPEPLVRDSQKGRGPACAGAQQGGRRDGPAGERRRGQQRPTENW